MHICFNSYSGLTYSNSSAKFMFLCYIPFFSYSAYCFSVNKAISRSVFQEIILPGLHCNTEFLHMMNEMY